MKGRNNANSSSLQLHLIDGLLIGLAVFIIWVALRQWFPDVKDVIFSYSNLEFFGVVLGVFTVVTIFKLYRALREVHQEVTRLKQLIPARAEH